MTTRDDTIQRGPVAIKNVAAFMVMTTTLINRESHLPGFGVCSGWSGVGKSWASIFAQNKTEAVRVECGDTWTRRTLLTKILAEFGLKSAKREPLSDLAERAIVALGENPRRPLIIDEADRLVDKGMIEVARELQEFSGAAVILIGEEQLPRKLERFERVHGRVHCWMQAKACDLADARVLAQAFAPKLQIADDLLDEIRIRSLGRARRIVSSIEDAKDIARNRNIKSLDLSSWGEQPFRTGLSPKVRDEREAIKPARAA
ncbi:AAA family ATPase [Rhodopseudomonas sp.]|uniref:AAA family ATPase n=1 Tax=Rhodopseudomonas sp. TaxID=1078 RepID=UPI0039E6AD0E